VARSSIRASPLLDGNKRLAWGCLNMFCALNGHRLAAEIDETVELMLAIAAGDSGEEAVTAWLMQRLR
jgi:death on curing protein